MDWTDGSSATALVARPMGRIDEGSWESFLAGLTDRVARAADGGRRLILDLADVDYMSSRGLRVLTLAKREADGRQVALSLARPNSRMRDILAISRYDLIFTVEQTLPEDAV